MSVQGSGIQSGRLSPSRCRCDGCRPGGGRPILVRWRRIFFTSVGSVITARIRIGEVHLGQTNGGIPRPGGRIV